MMEGLKRFIRRNDPLNIDELIRQAEEVKAGLIYTKLRQKIDYRNDHIGHRFRAS